MMRSLVVLVVLFVACGAMAQSPEASPVADKPAPDAAPAQKAGDTENDANNKAKDDTKRDAKNDAEKDAANDQLVRGLLRNAHALSRQLSPSDRIELLLRLARIARKKQPETAKQWVREAFRLSSEMHPSLRKAQYQAKAVSEIASLDSREALAMLPNLEIPAAAKKFDPRATAATAVFRECLKQHPDDWEQLSAAAQTMGEAGHYPFQAVSSVITWLQKKDEEAARSLMLQAVSAWHRSEHSPVNNLRMASLLAEHSSLLPPSTLKAVLGPLVANLQQANQDLPDSGAELQSSAANEAALALLMPLIGSMDPELQQKLKQTHASLGDPLIVDVDGDPTLIKGINIQPTDNADTITVTAGQADNETSDDTSNSVSSETSSEVRVLTATSEKEIMTLLGDTETALKNADDSEDRLQVLVGRALGLAAGERRDELATLLAEAFPLGEELFRKSIDDDRQLSWDDRPGANELSMLAETAAKVAPQAVMERIQNVRTAVLQAQLFVSLADGLQSPEASPAVVVMRINASGRSTNLP